MRYLAPTAFPIYPGDLLTACRPQPDAVARFAAELAPRVGAAQLLPVASGRAALALVLAALSATRHELGAGGALRREVALPAYTCPSLVKVILGAGFRPRLVEMDPQTLTFAPAALEHTLAARPVALIFVHPFGLGLDIAGVAEQAQAAGAIVIEDAAQAMGATVDGVAVGAGGDFGIFSVGPGKPLALGGGGLLALNRSAPPDLCARIDQAWPALPAPGWLGEAWSVTKLALVGLLFHPLGWRMAAALGIGRVGDSDAGQGYRLAKMPRAVAEAGSLLLSRWEDIAARRKANARAIYHALNLRFGRDERGNRLFPEPLRRDMQRAFQTGVYLRFPLLAPERETRDNWVAALQRHGIGAGKMYRQTLAARFPHLYQAPHEFPGATNLADRLLTLPTHHHLDAQAIEQMVRILASD